MANNFSRADIISAWRFESGALATDAKGVNTLSLVNTPTEDTTNMMEGSCCLALAGASSQYAKITDSNLAAGFPLKSGDAAKIITVSCWVRPNTVDANKRVIWAKHKNATGMRSLSLVHNSTQIYLRHNVTSTTVTDLSMAFGPMTANRKYFIMVGVDGIGVGGIPTYWFLIYDVTAGTWYCKSGVTAAGSLGVGTAEWRIGADDDLAANCYFDGQIDEVVVSNARLHNSEAVAIKGGNFPVTGNNIYDYLCDPSLAADTYDGFSSWAAGFKTLKHLFYPGDIILVAKSSETAAAGTVAAVLGSSTVNSDSASGQKVLKVAVTTSFRVGNPIIIGAGTARLEVNQIASIQAGVSLTLLMNMGYTHTAAQGDTVTSPLTVVLDTTDNLTAVIAQYTIIRLDNTLYMVKAISSTAITLYRPYRGAAGSGKSLVYFTGLPTSASQDWNTTAMTGTAANPITVQGGINAGTNAQDGFTILYGNNAYFITYSRWTRVNISRVAAYYWSYPWYADMVDCTLSTMFNFRIGSFSLGSTFTRVTFNDFVSELGNFAIGLYMYGCIFNNIETADPNNYGFKANNGMYCCTVNGLRNAGYSTYAALCLYSYVNEVQFIDSVLDELSSGCTNILTGSTNPSLKVYIRNPVLGPGPHFSVFTAGYYFSGNVYLTTVNKDGTDNRTYIGQPDNYTLISPDAVTYRTASPSAKVSLFQSAYPTVVRHYIPCDAGIQKTVSVYFRKNSSYGSVTLPIMRLRWMTGMAPNLISNVHDVTMADTNDNFLQSSYAVTPSVQGAIVMELIFQSANSGAFAWYDDIGVS